MKIFITPALALLFLFACSPKPLQNTTQFSITSTTTLINNMSTTAPENIQTIQASKTPKPIIPTETLSPQTIIEATIVAFGTICELPTTDQFGQISFDGNWIAMICKGSGDNGSSYLNVVNIVNGKQWKISYADYLKDDSAYPIAPSYWSQDGKYLYVTAESRGSGCCWIGWSLLLVRLNLETGEQAEIFNSDDQFTGVNFSISSDDRYVLYIPQDFNNTLYVLDTQTWKQKAIKLEDTKAGAGHTLMSTDNTKIILVLQDYPNEYQGDLTIGSYVLVDLKSGSQEKLLSDMEYWEMPIPVSWQDNENVLLQNEDAYWLLNIKTKKITETTEP